MRVVASHRGWRSPTAYRHSQAAVLVAAMVMSLLAIPAQPAAAQTDDNLSVIKDNESPSNAEIAARLSEETAFTDVDRVLISRDDNFADALAGGLMQSNSPLLLVPSSGPVSTRVIEEIERLGADSATILGGVAAVGEAVDSQLTGAGLTVERRQGGSRIETAIDIASNEAADAETAILARAFAADPDNPTQAFADTLGAGAMAASNGWPILLSQTDELSAATQEYLAQSAITEVQIVGGEAALSSAVESQIRALDIETVRIAGETRGETALEIAKAQGADTAADVDHVVLVDGTSEDGWAGGFAAAGRAALLDAPILLADGVRLLPETREFLEPVAGRNADGSFFQTTELSVTCVVHPLACTEGRRALGLSDYPLLSMNPLRGQVVAPGQQITATLSPESEGADAEILFDGTCIEESTELVRADSSGQATLNLSTDLPVPACTLNVTYEGEEGAVLRTSTAYITEGQPFRTADQALLSSGLVVYGDVVPATPVYINDTITCTPPGGAPTTRDSFAMTAQFQQDGVAGLDVLTNGSDQVITTRDAVCDASIQLPSGVSSVVYWGVYSQTDSGLRIPLELGTGTTATFDLAQLEEGIGADLSDLSIQWAVRVEDARPIAPPPSNDGLPGVVSNRDGLPLLCDGEAYAGGLHQVGAGAQCSVPEVTNEVNYLLVQPNEDVISAPSLAFSALADPRPSVIALQVLAQPRPENAWSRTRSANWRPRSRWVPRTAEPSQSPAQPATTRWSLDQELDVRIRANNPFGPQSEGLDPIVTVYDAQGTELAMNDDEVEGDLRGSRIDDTLAAGEYCIGVSGFEDTAGDYLVSVDPAPAFVRSFTPTDDEAFGFYSYTGEEGDEIVFEARQATSIDGSDPFMLIFNDAETSEELETLTDDNDGGGAPNARIEFVMPYTGSITIGVGSLTDEGEIIYEATSPVEDARFAAASPTGAPTTAGDAMADDLDGYAGRFR